MLDKVAYMQKITLSLEYGVGIEPERETASCPPVEFVYGMGTSGLTPLEIALADKTVGDAILLQLQQSQIPVFFGHIRYPAFQAPGPSDEIFLKARILTISPASSREVVRTLADVANCGDSCCGHHGSGE